MTELREPPQVSRRTMLRAATVTTSGAAAVAVLAACSSDSSGGGSGATGTTGTSAAGTSTAGTSGSGTSAAATSGATTSAEAPSGTKVAALTDIQVGSSGRATLGGDPIVLTRTADQTIVGFSAVCPHQGCDVAPSGEVFVRPCHKSRFEAATGKVLQGPAVKDLTKLSVSVSGGEIYAQEA